MVKKEGVMSELDQVQSRLELRRIGDGKYKAHCPFHDDERDTLEIRTFKEPAFRCWACGKHGSLADLISSLR